ncbi:MAG: hypothetical protein V7677_08910 [Motiliproteus sp.]
MSSTLPSTPSSNSFHASMNRIKRWWHLLAYHHRGAEISLHLLFVSGIPLWSLFALSWGLERSLLFIHSIAGILLFPLYVLPFWISHRRLLSNSKKSLLRKTGRYLDMLIILCALSGSYLILIGNRGDLFGLINHYLHLVTAIPLTLLLVRHALRWSILSWLIKPLGRRHG